jgi:hypothetical protein
MTLNPFEQLRFLHSVPDPGAAFEDVAAILLRDHGLTDGQVKIHVGDGGIDSYQGSFGRGGELVVYQMKYFPAACLRHLGCELGSDRVPMGIDDCPIFSLVRQCHGSLLNSWFAVDRRQTLSISCAEGQRYWLPTLPEWVGVSRMCS